MARRSDHSKAEKVAMIIQSGQEIIAKEGLRGFSARKVASQMGYTVGTVYNILGSHDEIILHINAATLDELNEYIVARMNSRHRGSRAVKKLAGHYLEFAQTHYNRWSALFEHSLPQGMELPAWYFKKISSLFEILETPLLPLANENPEQAKLLAKTVWAGFHGICALGLTGKLDVIGVDSTKKMMDRLIDNYLRGLSH